MKKKIATACLFLGLGCSVNATEMSNTKAFIGLELGYSQVQGDTSRLGLLFSDTQDSALNYGLRIGAGNSEWRTTFLYNYYNNTDSDQNLEVGLFTLDYYFMESAMGSDSAFHPYLGFNIGYGNYETTNLPNSNGMLYGGQGGLLFDVTENIDMDVSYRHSFSNSDALNHIGAVMLGVNYLY